MGNFFAGEEYTGAPFVLFGTAHLIALGIAVLFNVLIVVWGRRNPPEKARRAFRYVLAVSVLVSEALWHTWNAVNGMWSIQTMLPLHLCSVLVYVSAIMLVTGSYRIYEFSYFFGIGGASQALLTPDAAMWGFPHFRFFQCMTAHTLIVAAAITMTFVEGYRPTWKSLLRAAVGINIYMVFVMGVNVLLGSNYMFIARKPATASLIDVLGPWPWYILSLEAIGAALLLLLYAPYAIKDWRARAAGQPQLAPSGEG